MGLKSRKKYVQAELWERDGDKCYLCGLPMVHYAADTYETLYTKATIDHVISRANGGSDHMDNLKFAHRICNERKASCSSLSENDIAFLKGMVSVYWEKQF